MEVNEKLNPNLMSPYDRMRFAIFKTIDNEVKSSWASNCVDAVIMFLIVMSMVCTIAESFDALRDWYGEYFDYFETLTLVVFSIEYILRVWTADFKFPQTNSKRKSRIKFVFSGTGLLDLLAIIPFVFQILFPVLSKYDLRLIRLLKVTRMLRVLKLNSFTSSVVVVGDVFFEKRYELGVTLFTTLIVMMVASTLLYYCENEVQPEQFSDILSTMWWAVATLTTVGYGDIYPITPLGKILGSVIAVLGLGVVALPTGLIGAAFIEKIEKKREAEKEKLAQAKLKSKENNIVAMQEDIHALCGEKFGECFIYCPYCGIELAKHNHMHELSEEERL